MMHTVVGFWPWQQNMSDERFEADAKWVIRDLTALKILLEAQPLHLLV